MCPHPRAPRPARVDERCAAGARDAVRGTGARPGFAGSSAVAEREMSVPVRGWGTYCSPPRGEKYLLKFCSLSAAAARPRSAGLSPPGSCSQSPGPRMCYRVLAQDVPGSLQGRASGRASPDHERVKVYIIQ